MLSTSRRACLGTSSLILLAELQRWATASTAARSSVAVSWAAIRISHAQGRRLTIPTVAISIRTCSIKLDVSTVPETTQTLRPCNPTPARTPGNSREFKSPLPKRSTVTTRFDSQRTSRFEALLTRHLPSSSSWKLPVPQLSGSASTS